jgi:hypothetical protein
MTTRTARIIDETMINLHGELFESSAALPVQSLTPAREGPRSSRVIDDTLVVLSGELFASTSVEEPIEDRAPRPEVPRMRPRRKPRPVTRRAWEPASVLTGLVLGIAFGAGAVVGMEAIPPLPERAEVLLAARPIVEAITASIEVAAPAPESSAREAERPAPSTTAAAIWRGLPAPVALPPAPAPPPRADAPVEAAPPAASPAAAGIDTAAAATAIAIAAARASGCIDPEDPRTTMPVRVTFAPSGRVTSATVAGGPFAGTDAGGCIAMALRNAKVGPFEGPAVTVRRSVRIR